MTEPESPSERARRAADIRIEAREYRRQLVRFAERGISPLSTLNLIAHAAEDCERQAEELDKRPGEEEGHGG